MYIQGDLQKIFDVLHKLGLVEPTIKLDWNEYPETSEFYKYHLSKAVKVIQLCNDNTNIMANSLSELDHETLTVLTIEVAKEFSDYHCDRVIH